MYSSYNSEKAIHEAHERELLTDAHLQAAEQIIYAGLLARLRTWLAMRRKQSGSASKVESPSQDFSRTNVLTLK
jgi:hypothetical protein